MAALNRTQRRTLRNRAKLRAVSDRPRLSVFRSNQYIYAQIIDDASGTTLAQVGSKSLATEGNKTDAAKAVGKALAEAAAAKGIKEVVFDRGSYRYHGRVKALADGAREGGLVF